MVGRCGIEIEGIVQGVGFRPFVYGLASRLHLHGFVRNRTNGVQIEVEGESSFLKQFVDELVEHAPAAGAYRLLEIHRPAAARRSRLYHRVQ